MKQSLTLFTWFSGILVVVVLVIDILLGFKFKRYFRANGFGIVTLTLLSLVAAHALGAFVFGITSLTIMISAGNAEGTFYTMRDLGSLWLVSSTLLHIMGITFQRVFSFSYGNRFLKFTRSKTNIGVLILTMWLVSLIITILCLTSRSAATYSVFYLGLFISGTLTILNFAITVETSLFKNKGLVNYDELEVSNSEVHSSNQARKVHVIQNPRKTFSLFSGLVFSFILFCLPASIPNLIFNLRGELLSQSTSLAISLWLLLGVVFNSMWILMRLRSTINDTSGFYARWSFGKSMENVAVFLRRNKKSISTKTRLIKDEFEDSTCRDTEQENI